MSSSKDYEVVVVGAGPAGLAAACAAAESGCKVALVDDSPWTGGQIWRGWNTSNARTKAQEWHERAVGAKVEWLDRTSVIASPEPGTLLASHPAGSRTLTYKRAVLATGARELFLPFPGWTLPGVFGAGGLQSLVKQGWPIAGKKVVVAGSGPLLIAVADGLRKHGATVLTTAEQAPWGRVMRFGLELLKHPEKLQEAIQVKFRNLFIPYECGVWPMSAEGGKVLERVSLTNGRDVWTHDCDALACGFGLIPNLELPRLVGCEVSNGFVVTDQWQETTVAGVYAAGELNGITGVDCALVEGLIAGFAAADNYRKAEALFEERAVWLEFRDALASAFALRPELKELPRPETIICRCEDVTFGKLKPYRGGREAKLQTRCGMGACQGRVCGGATNFLFGWFSESSRPPILPTRIKSLLTTSRNN